MQPNDTRPADVSRNAVASPRVVRAVQMGFCEHCGRTMQLDHLLEFYGKHVCFYPCYCELAEAWNDAEREAYYDRFHHAGTGGY